jgi:hypothetical protein
MNLANELDIELDVAVKRHLGRLFDSYFVAQNPEAGLVKFKGDVKQLAADYKTLSKILDDVEAV